LCIGGISYTSFGRRGSLRYAIVLVHFDFKVSTEVDWQRRPSHFTILFTDLSTPLDDFFFWGYLKDAVYMPLLPTTLPELVGRI
jgi:hypothetical protein